MGTLPNPSHQGRGTHPYTPLKRGFTGEGKGEGVMDFCKSLTRFD